MTDLSERLQRRIEDERNEAECRIRYARDQIKKYEEAIRSAREQIEHHLSEIAEAEEVIRDADRLVGPKVEEPEP